jgi:hypothetical protein
MPIVNPPLINQKEAKAELISKYSSLIGKHDFMPLSFDHAWIFFKNDVDKGRVKLQEVKSSYNGRFIIFLFSYNDASNKSHPIIAFEFYEGAKIKREAHSNGFYSVSLKNGFMTYGKQNVDAEGWPAAGDDGVYLRLSEGSSVHTNLLFRYNDGTKQEGEELISIFLSAFPVLKYE